MCQLFVSCQYCCFFLLYESSNNCLTSSNCDQHTSLPRKSLFWDQLLDHFPCGHVLLVLFLIMHSSSGWLVSLLLSFFFARLWNVRGGWHSSNTETIDHITTGKLHTVEISVVCIMYQKHACASVLCMHYAWVIVCSPYKWLSEKMFTYFYTFS